MIENWHLGFEFADKIANIWNAEIYNAESGKYIIKNAGWNADISVGGSVEFGFGANEDFSVFPKTYELLGENTETDVLDYTVDYHVGSDWKSGFTGEYEGVLEDLSNYRLYTYNLLIDPDNKADNEEEHRLLTWDEMQDTDGDGLPDSYETIIGTDPNCAETDGDGLTDGYEVLYSSTDPSDKYTMKNGVADGNLDPDTDDLTILQEQTYGTDPLYTDTDYDGLTDGEEVFRYGTDPLKYDTDDDGIGDGDEIVLALNPRNPATFGCPDSEYRTVHVVLSEDALLQEINNNKDYRMKFEAEGCGNPLEGLIVRESAYSTVIDNDSILGILPEFLYEQDNNAGKLEKMKLSFEINPSVVPTEYSTNDFKGINRYNIFWYNTKVNMLLPLDTKIDENSNTISAEVTELGTYCVMDIEKWLLDLGFTPMDGIQMLSLMEEDNAVTDSMPILYSGISDVAAANIYCCAVHPMIGSGSWYAQLTHFTDGLIISNYNTFSEDVLNYIYGYVPEVPFSYKMISSLGLKPIYLDSELKVNGTADTDLDGLTDWTEVNQKYVTANEDGSVILLTFSEFCRSLIDNGEWTLRFQQTLMMNGQFKSGADCEAYQDSWYSPAVYQGTVAHEFGHVFGLKDMYGSAPVNHGYEPIANTELVYDTEKDVFALPQAKGIMTCNGSACANDIEMIMLSFSENMWQYYVPYGSTQVISKAIKKAVKYNNIDPDVSYQYVRNNEKKIFE